MKYVMLILEVGSSQIRVEHFTFVPTDYSRIRCGVTTFQALGVDFCKWKYEMVVHSVL